jgi:two-component system heavy metal sensor histidine kinase CusS
MSSNPARDAARWSLAARLTAWYTAASFLLVLGAVAFLYWALLSSLEREDDEALAEKIDGIRQLLRERADATDVLRREVAREGRRRQLGQVYVRILNGSGKLVVETPGMREQLALDVFPAPTASDQPLRGREVQAADNRTLRIAAVLAPPGSAGQPPGVIQVAMDRTFEEEIMERYRSYLAFTLLASLILCSLVSYWLVRRGLRPLRELASTAEGIRSSTLHERVSTGRLPADLAKLAQTFNAMLDRLQESFTRLAQFSADIAHELRTPLSNLRSEAEVALSQPRSAEEYARVLGSCLEEGVRLSGLVDTLLFLARAEQPQAQIQRGQLDLTAELKLVRDFFEAPASDSGVRLEVDAQAPVWIQADRSLIQRALSNLVANALTYTPRGGVIRLLASSDSRTARVSVTDTGAGIDPEHLPHIFDRFYRVDAARADGSSHVGLGLAIVASIVRLHGGQVCVESELGRGTRITLTIPTGNRSGKMLNG